ncbi:hypothetical protein [Microbacterium testaceum]|nr:hypothetical protein [Microbacterium testaceum]
MPLTLRGSLRLRAAPGHGIPTQLRTLSDLHILSRKTRDATD